MMVEQSRSPMSLLLLVSLFVAMMGLLGGVVGQVPPTPVPTPPTPIIPPTPPPFTPPPPTPVTPTPIPTPPTPVPPTPVTPPTPVPPTPVTPTPVTPTPIPPTTPRPPTPRPPIPHPDMNTKFYLLEVRIPKTCSSSTLRSSFLRSTVKEVADLFFKVAHYPELDLIHLFKAVGDPLIKAVVRGGLSNGIEGLPLINKLENSLCNLGLTLKTTPLSSLEAFANAIGVDSSLTKPPRSRFLDPHATIHCYTIEIRPRATDNKLQALLDLTEVTTFILRLRQSGRNIDGYRVLATDPPQLFICANTLISYFDMLFNQFWTVTDKPDVTSIKNVCEVQPVDKYLMSGGSSCGSFWCHIW